MLNRLLGRKPREIDVPEGKPALVAVTSDWHTNDTLGLSPPVFRREKLAVHMPGPAVMALWQAWTEFWEIITIKKKELGAEVYVICNGDLCDFNFYSQVQLISMRKEDVLGAMLDVAEPMLSVADHIFVVRGTAAHTEGTGGLEDFFAADIGAEHCDSEGATSWWTLRAKFGGVRFDVTHHPPSYSRLPWTQVAAVERCAAVVAARYLKAGHAGEVPDIAIFGHAHYSAEGKGLGVHGFFLPPLKLVGEFGHRLGAGAHVERVGGLWLLCQGGEVLDWRFELWEPSREGIWSSIP